MGKYGILIYFFAIAAFFYFFMIKPNKKQQTQIQNTLNNLKVGDKIVTRSGMRGTITFVDDVCFIIKTGPNDVEVEFLKAALAYIVTPTEGYEEAE